MIKIEEVELLKAEKRILELETILNDIRMLSLGLKYELESSIFIKNRHSSMAEYIANKCLHIK